MNHWYIELIFFKCFALQRTQRVVKHNFNKSQNNFFRGDTWSKKSGPHSVFSQPPQNQRWEMREEICTGHCSRWSPVEVTCWVGSVLEGRTEKSGILSSRVSHEETSGTLIKTGLEMKHNCFSRQVYILAVKFLGRNCASYFYSPSVSYYGVI